MSKAKSKRNSISRNARRLLVFYLYVLTWNLLQILPQKIACGLMDFLAMLAYYVVGRQRKLVLSNLHTAFPDISESERRLIARRMYRNLSRNLVEFARFGKLKESGKLDELVEVVGKEHLDEAYSRGKGVLILSAHLGNWELLASCIVEMGHRLTILVRRIDYARYDSFLDFLRSSSGVDTINRDNVREILRRLTQGQAIGMNSDQDVSKLNGVYVDFLGSLAYTPTGIVTLGLRNGSPIVPAFIIRRSDGKHNVFFEPEIKLVKTGNRGWDTLINTSRYTKAIEKYVKAYPEQWMWFHNRWRRRPEFGFIKGLCDKTAPATQSR